MELNSEWPCWEIMKCEGTDNCPAKNNPKTPCWEIANKLEDYRSAFNICKDCIVYLLKQDEPVLTEHEIEIIMESKKNIPCALTVS